MNDLVKEIDIFMWEMQWKTLEGDHKSTMHLDAVLMLLLIILIVVNVLMIVFWSSAVVHVILLLVNTTNLVLCVKRMVRNHKRWKGFEAIYISKIAELTAEK